MRSVPFKEVWAGIGDSIVVVGGDGLWNCHIHTDDVGAAIEAALDAGRPRDIRVTDLLDQVEEESWVRRAEEFGAGTPPVAEGPPPVTSVVAVATGDGDPPHLPLARRAPHRRRRPVDEPLHRADPRGHGVGPRGRGRHPAEQQEHRRRRQTGARAVATAGLRGGHARASRRGSPHSSSTTPRRPARRTPVPCRRPPHGCVPVR